jgi:hypothetical protein
MRCCARTRVVASFIYYGKEHGITPIYFAADKYRHDVLTETKDVLNKILKKE